MYKELVKIYAKSLCTAIEFRNLRSDLKEEMLDNYISLENIFQELNIPFDSNIRRHSRGEQGTVIGNARKELWKVYYSL